MITFVKRALHYYTKTLENVKGALHIAFSGQFFALVMGKNISWRSGAGGI
jgi:hypothetical protein